MLPSLDYAPWYWLALYAVVSYISVAYLIAFVVYVVFYKLFRRQFQEQKIQAAYTSDKIIRHEISYSFFTLLIHSLAGALVIFLSDKGLSLAYRDISQYGYIYYCVSVLLMIALHDTYFYWTHRFMHLRRVYPIVHRVHHVSINPSPWAAYSGHPLEAAIAAGIFPLIAFLIPAHWTAMAIYLLYMLFMSVMGHAGFEFYPKKFLRSWFGRWQTTATHHNMHHQLFNGNYGIYFNFWDKVMKTERAEYTETFEKNRVEK